MVISAIGPDKIGLAEQVADIVANRNCNIEESKMAVLGGEFAVIVLISGEDTEVVSLMEMEDELAKMLGMHVEMRETNAPHSAHVGLPYVIESVSMDTPGIVYSLTSVLTRYKVNIEDLETSTTSAPWTGAPMFRMRTRITIPPKVQVATLREEFNQIALEKDLDISIVPDIPSL